MGWFDGWPFKSKEESEQERVAFEKRVFPFGEAQRECCKAVLEQIITAKKMRDTDKMFAFILAKDRFAKGEQSEESMEAARRELSKMRWMPPEQMELLLALVRLDARLPSLEDYPTAEDVLRAAAQYGAGSA